MHIFDQDMQLQEYSDHRLRADISECWTHRGNMNGGFLLSLASKAASRYSDKTGSLIITANYLDRTVPGEVDINVEELSKSGNFDRFEVTLIQDNKKVLKAFCTLSRKTGESEDIAGKRDYLPTDREEDCIEIVRPGTTPLYESLSVRIAPSTSAWLKGELKKPANIKGWVRFREPRDFDLIATNIAVDCFPPSIFSSHGLTAWVPTLELTVFINKTPDVDVLWADFNCNYITDGIIIEDCIVTDSEGSIVAASRQTAVYRQES